METATLKIGNQEIDYSSSGNSKNALVFLHGNSLSAALFKNQLTSSELSNFRLVAFDLPGHGFSAKAANPLEIYTLNNITDLIAQVLSELKIDSCILVGHSLGGHLALQAYHKIKEKVKGIFIFGTPPLGFPPNLGAAYHPDPALMLAYKPDLGDDELNVLASKFTNDAANYSVVLDQLKKSDPAFRGCIAMEIMGGKLADETAIVAGLAIPLAVIQAENDPIVNVEYFKMLNMPTLWKKEIQLIKNSGHSPQLENAVGLNKMVLNFAEHCFN